MKKAIVVLVVLSIAGAGYWYYGRAEKVEESPYRFVTVEKGDLEATVSSTGTLSAVTTVQVGTQVSGRVSDIFVDFNDRVRRGQLIAKIDTILLASAIRDAQASLERARAQLNQSEREFNRVKPLYEKKIITEVEYNQAQYDHEIARAQMVSSQVNLERARQNLGYATIRAPIDGTVVERNVDVGQTVAASFSAPQLFLIANDLTRMQILAAVDESDIGQIRQGQRVRFNVQAYTDRTFYGNVRQIRLQSKTENNVVNYTVVVDVNNDDGKLLPGMTATVDFLIDQASGVFKVPNAALRLRATSGMFDQVAAQLGPPGSNGFRGTAQPASNVQGPGTANRSGNPGGQQRSQTGANASGRQTGSGDRQGYRMAGAASSDAGPRSMAMLWFVDEKGSLKVLRVQTGLTDGQTTEIRGEGIKEGLQVISGVRDAGTSTQQGASSPFQQQRFQGPRGPGG